MLSSHHQDAADSHSAFAWIPEGDPARALVSAIVSLVPATQWSFARFQPGGDEAQMLSSKGSDDEFRRAKEEYALQVNRTTAGPRIGLPLRPLGEFSSGLTLLFADSHARFGILTLLRTGELGPFTSSEIRTLTFALDATSDRFSELRLMESEDRSLSAFRLEHSKAPESVQETGDDDVARYILNEDLEIVLAWTSENQRRTMMTPSQGHLENRLPRVLEETVRTLTAAWTDDDVTRQPGIAHPVPFLVVRARPMASPTGLFIGVSIERSKPAHSLTRAAARFRISPREVQVLALLLDGAHLNEAAERLHITSSTVQDHIKSLLEKTGTENRSEMIAKILGWS